MRYEIYRTQINECDWLLFGHHGTIVSTCRTFPSNPEGEAVRHSARKKLLSMHVALNTKVGNSGVSRTGSEKGPH